MGIVPLMALSRMYLRESEQMGCLEGEASRRTQKRAHLPKIVGPRVPQFSQLRGHRAADGIAIQVPAPRRAAQKGGNGVDCIHCPEWNGPWGRGA